MPTDALTSKASAQAIYMQYLLEKARKDLITKFRPAGREAATIFAFDPQGRLLTDVTLGEVQYGGIVHDINKALGTNYKETKAGLEEALGMSTTPTVTVSLDITGSSVLQMEFKRCLELALLREAKVTASRSSAILSALKDAPKGSIIALQQEFHFHLALASRIYQQAGRKTDGIQATATEIVAAHQAAMLRVNERVMAAYAKALNGAMKGETLDIAKLNKALDKARKEIAPDAHTFLMEEMAKIGIVLTKEQIKAAKKSLRSVAERTTATPNDILHTDRGQGLATLIRGSEETAHERKPGDKFPDRQLIAHAYDGVSAVTPNLNPRIQIRTPSLAFKDTIKPDGVPLYEHDYIEDVATKLLAVTNKYGLSTRLSGGGESNKPKAFIYNLYTALNDGFGDMGGNLQTQSARHILIGAHSYNKAQLASGDPVFCFVYGISVNGFGGALRYDSGDDLLEESTLMTEMALVHTLYEVEQEKYNALSSQLRNASFSIEEHSPGILDSAESRDSTYKTNVRAVMKEYRAYLKRTDDKKPAYFSQSEEGRCAKALIQSIKTEWKKHQSGVAYYRENMLVDAKQSLKTLMAHDIHFSHDHAKLFQALSVFVEEASIGGCKSGNERAQSINGRVAIFDAILSKKETSLTEDEKKIKKILHDLATTTGSTYVLELAKTLKTLVDKVYNERGLQTAASLVSLVDQGASAKIEGKPGHPFYVSRNYGEEPASVMTNLHQTKAGSMQAHKGLTLLMHAAMDGHPQSWWSRMKSSPLGTFGAIIGTVIAFPVAIGVAIYTAVDNSQRKARTDAMIKAAGTAVAPSRSDAPCEDSTARVTRMLQSSHPTPARVAYSESTATATHTAVPSRTRPPAMPAIPEGDEHEHVDPEDTTPRLS